MNNTITNKIKKLPQLLIASAQIALKHKWHYFRSWSTISTRLGIYVHQCKGDCICEGVLQSICLVEINVWLDLLLEINPYFKLNLS